MREFNALQIPKPALEFHFDPGARLGVDLEIGAGQGLHAIRYAQANPNRLLLAVERTHERFHSLARRLARHPEIENLRPFHADAVAFVTYFLPPESLDRVFLLYPNPYPKAKQANLRWYNMPFFRELLHKMKPGADLTLATNIPSYAEEARAALKNVWKLEEISFSVVEPKSAPRTHFEKKYLQRGETCWNLHFRKSCWTDR